MSSTKKLTNKQLLENLTVSERNVVRWQNSYNEEAQKRRTAEESLKESREHFADLKERLANAEAETARLRGYLERVHEDDVVRDGLVEIEDGDGKRMVPRRPPPLMRYSGPSPEAFLSSTDNYGRPKKRTHWTNY